MPNLIPVAVPIRFVPLLWLDPIVAAGFAVEAAPAVADRVVAVVPVAGVGLTVVLLEVCRSAPVPSSV